MDLSSYKELLKAMEMIIILNTIQIHNKLTQESFFKLYTFLCPASCYLIKLLGYFEIFRSPPSDKNNL